MHKTQSITLFAAIVTSVLVSSSAAQSDFLKGDPRVCRYGPERRADCAETAAATTLVAYMRTHGHPSFSNPVNCTRIRTLLRWRCDYGTGTAQVTFRATSTGWKRVVTFTA